jgi:hypothetical protein
MIIAERGDYAAPYGRFYISGVDPNGDRVPLEAESDLCKPRELKAKLVRRLGERKKFIRRNPQFLLSIDSACSAEALFGPGALATGGALIAHCVS